MKGLSRYFWKIGHLVVISLTFILFVLSLFVQGITHDLLLEAGIFLVSVKLILSTYQILSKLDRIEEKLSSIEKKQ
jgi:hypothetical protein